MSATVPREGWRTLSLMELTRALEKIKGARGLPGPVLDTVRRAFEVRVSEPVRLDVERRRLGAISILMLTMSEMRVRDLPFSRANTVHVAFVLDGSVTMIPREGDAVELLPGDMSLITNWSMFDVSCRANTRVVHILIPESVLRERGVRVRSARFRLEGSRTLGGPLLGLARELIDTAWEPSVSATRVAERAVEDLVVGFLLESEDTELDREDLRARLRRRALDEVAARSTDIAMTPSTLAGALGVSLRHLQRAFEGSGMTVAQHIARHRVRAAAVLLVSPGADALTVAEVARASGFASPFELRSAFRSEHGVLPSEFRAARVSLTTEQVDSYATATAGSSDTQ